MNNGWEQIKSEALMGRPVIFSEDKDRDQVAQDRLVRAAELAGFKNISFQLEPIAAALAYENSLEAGKEQIVLVGDFGAGSSDFTIHKAGKKAGTKAQREQDILSVGGVYIGGDVFDSQIMREKVATYYGKNVQVKSMWSDNFFGLSPIVIRKLMQPMAGICSRSKPFFQIRGLKKHPFTENAIPWRN